MNVYVVAEIRVQMTADGRHWIPNSFSADFWGMYREVFDQVLLVARVEQVAGPSHGWIDAAEAGVGVIALPNFVGPDQLAFKLPQVLGTLSKICARPGAFVLRSPGMLAEICSRMLAFRRRPFAIEVVGDPRDSLGAGSAKSAILAVARTASVRNLRWMARTAAAVGYVNRTTLPDRYPADASAHVDYYSSIVLEEDQLIAADAIRIKPEPPYRLITVGTLEQMYKGVDVLLRAVAICRSEGGEFSLDIVGEGRLRAEYETMAADIGVADSVRFLGHLPKKDVFSVLDDADVFVLPARAEGLPRALIEAMARGKPAVASDVGGIPELLEPQYLCAAGDVAGLATRILEITKDQQVLRTAALENRRRAADYIYPVLRQRRIGLYLALHARTSEVRGSAVPSSSLPVASRPKPAMIRREPPASSP